jgi:hypothetical protein
MARPEAPRGVPVQVGNRPAAPQRLLWTSVLICGPIFRCPGEPAGAPAAGWVARPALQGEAASIPMPAALLWPHLLFGRPRGPLVGPPWGMYRKLSSGSVTGQRRARTFAFVVQRLVPEDGAPSAWVQSVMSPPASTVTT